MSIFAVVLILAVFAAGFLYVHLDLDKLAHEQRLDELWDDEEVGADDLHWASSDVGAGTFGGAA